MQRHELKELLGQLRRLKKGDFEKRVVHKPDDVYYWFLFPAFVCLLVGACMSERRRGDTP